MKTTILTLLFALLTSQVLAQTEEESRNLGTIKRWEEIWNNGKYDLMPDTVAASYIRHEPKGNRVITRDKYLEEIKHFREKLNVRFQFLKVSADHDRIWLLWSASSTNPESGENKFGRGVQLYRLEDGKLAETWWMGSLDSGAWAK